MTVDLDGVEKLIAALGTALAALLTPIGVIYVAAISKKNKSVEDSVASLREQLDDLHEKLEKAEKMVDHERISGLRWYQEMINWYNLAQEVRRHALDARQVAESYSNVETVPKLPKPVWNASITLPPLSVVVPYVAPERTP